MNLLDIRDALNKVLAGATVVEVAHELGVDSDLLNMRLLKLPEYREYREQYRQALEQKKAAALALARQGYSPAVIARKVEAPEGTVNNWMKRAGIDTSISGNDDMTCPECGGTMKKQELFFWQCECGAEFWPPDEQVPDDPDEWTRPWRVRTDDGAAVAILMQRLYNEGNDAVRIAAALNEAGHLTPRGRPWTRTNVLAHLKRHGIMAGSEDYQAQRERINEIVLSMAGHGYNSRDIADRLNMEGFKTNRGREWTLDAVYKLIRISLKSDAYLPFNKGVARIKALKGTLKGDKNNHPWVKDEEIRRAAVKARYKKDDLPSLQKCDE
ncbi:recombinase family protein [Sporotomaculum syntrophicum]|uniref:recombinase family protein n=1 Tax=Sporotomaculum syntrophicum TaxID=182264 RepID=UPI00137AC3A8|nr:recombinase family protein [Sporotomaculum syntrophicum]